MTSVHVKHTVCVSNAQYAVMAPLVRDLVAERYSDGKFYMNVSMPYNEHVMFRSDIAEIPLLGLLVKLEVCK